jgi:PDZ domain-containing secreted protein
MKKELDSDGEYPDMEGWEEADDEDEESSDEEFEKSNQRGKRQAKKSSNQNDLNFEKTFEEYDESAIGYLSDADEEDLQGKIELDGEDLLFNQAIDEFIQDKKDSILAEGVTVKKGESLI